MTSIFQSLYDALAQNRPAVLATVISSKGSLPMSKRAKMLVFSDGSIRGTVGGGILEASVIKEAQKLFNGQIARVIDFDLTSDQIEADGMTCGGVVKIFLEHFSPGSNLALIQQLARSYKGAKNAVVATILPEPENAPVREARKILLTESGELYGTLGNEHLDRTLKETLQPYLTKETLQLLDITISDEDACQPGRIPESCLKLYVETVLPPPTAYLFGGGHVSQHLAMVLNVIGFDYVVADDRQGFLRKDLFPHAKDFILCDFSTVLKQLELNSRDSYLVIVTRGHKSDLVVLRQALQRDLKYIGMIGSKRKVKLLLEELRREGVPSEKLEQVHAPIGLAIGADTLEEIAISIAAELIQVRRAKR